MRVITILVIAALVFFVGCDDERSTSVPTQHPAIAGPAAPPTATNHDDTKKYEEEIVLLKADLQSARAVASDQWSKGWSGGYNQAISEDYPMVFADMGRVYLMSGPLPLADVRLEVNYKASGGGYFHLMPNVESFHIWRIPQRQFLDENGKEMSSEQKIVSVRVKATTRGKPLVKIGDTLDTAPDTP